MKDRPLTNPFLRWPLPMLVLCLLAGGPWLRSLQNFTVRSDAKALLEGDQRNLAAYEKVSALLKNDTVVVLSMAGDELFTQEGLNHLRAVCDAISDLPGLGDVKSLTHSVKPVRQGFSFGFAPFVPAGELSAAEIQKIRAYATTHPLVKNLMVAPDAKHAIITCHFDRDFSTPDLQRQFREEIDELTRPFESLGYSFKTVALPLVALEIRTAISQDIRELSIWLGVIVTVLLLVAFRSVRLTFLCLLNIAFVLALLPGMMKSMGVPLTFYSLMLFPLVAGIQLTLITHLFMGCVRAGRDGLDPDEAIRLTLRRVMKSCAFASLTTVVGMLSLTVCAVRQVSDFGWIGAAGIALAFCWTFGPGVAALKLFLPAGASAGERKPIVWNADWWAEAMVRRRGLILAVGAASLVLAGIGIGKIRTDIRVTEFLDRSSPTRVALQEFDEVYGGINVVQFKIDSGVENGINDLGFLSYVDQIQRFAAEKAKVSGTYSYTQLMAMMNQIWEGEKEGSLRLPNNPMMVGMFALALKVRKFPFIDALADEEFRTANVIVRTRGMLSSEYLELLREIVAFAEENRPEGVTVSAQQGIHSILEADRRVLDAQINSFTLTFAIIGLTLLFLWRSFWLAALALLVNVIPVGLAISLAGYGDLPLNSVTVMVAAIVLGIAVDDSVHFITWWRDEYRKSGDAKQALASTFRVKGPPILCTSLILTAVFGAFLVFSFPPVRHFGLLSAVAFVGAIFSTLALLPALLRPRPVSAPLSPAND